MIHPATVAQTQGVSSEQFDSLLYALRQAGYVLMRTDDLPPGWQDRYTPEAAAMNAADRLAAAAIATIQLAGDPDGVDMTPLANAVREYEDERAEHSRLIRSTAQRYMDEQRALRDRPEGL